MALQEKRGQTRGALHLLQPHDPRKAIAKSKSIIQVNGDFVYEMTSLELL